MNQISLYPATLAALCLALVAPVRAAGALGGPFAVRSADFVVHNGVIELDAHVQYPMNRRIREALQGGVTLVFDLDVEILRPRRFWFDATALSIQVRRQLSYHAVSGRYVLQNRDGVEQQSAPTLSDALSLLGHLHALPIMVRSQLRGRGPWIAQVRASVRRGRIPDALRLLMFWSSDWHRATPWYVWRPRL